MTQVEPIGVQFSQCRTYRYTLDRHWSLDVQRRCMFLMLNPSTADETEDDPTIRRCIDFAKRWGFDGLYVGNLYAFRSTDPNGLWAVDDPVGPENDRWLLEMASRSEFVVFAWGMNATIERASAVIQSLREAGRDLRHLALTKGGAPGHPLYLKANLQPQRWVWP